MHPNSVFLDIPAHTRAPQLLCNAVVALFDSSLEIPKPTLRMELQEDAVGMLKSQTTLRSSVLRPINASLGAESWNQNEERSFVEEENTRYLESVGESLRALGVRLVCCQRLIHPFLKSWLISHDIIPLERISIRHIGNVRLLRTRSLLIQCHSNVIRSCCAEHHRSSGSEQLVSRSWPLCSRLYLPYRKPNAS